MYNCISHAVNNNIVFVLHELEAKMNFKILTMVMWLAFVLLTLLSHQSLCTYHFLSLFSSFLSQCVQGEVDTVSTNIESGLLIRGESALAVDNLETEHNSAAATMDSSTIPFTSGSCTISTTSTVSSNSSNLHLEPPITFRMLMTSKVSSMTFSYYILLGH